MSGGSILQKALLMALQVQQMQEFMSKYEVRVQGQLLFKIHLILPVFQLNYWKNVKVIHISKDETESAISTMEPWDFVLEAKGVTSCHVAKCSDSIVKMWQTALTDDEAAVT